MGLRGVAAGKLDAHAPGPLNKTQRQLICKRLLERFSMDEFARALMSDVNQQDAEAERVVSRDALTKWVGDEGTALGFSPHDVFYDEDRAEEYDGSKPREENEYQPFLSLRVAKSIIIRLFRPV